MRPEGKIKGWGPGDGELAVAKAQTRTQRPQSKRRQPDRERS